MNGSSSFFLKVSLTYANLVRGNLFIFFSFIDKSFREFWFVKAVKVSRAIANLPLAIFIDRLKSF